MVKVVRAFSAAGGPTPTIEGFNDFEKTMKKAPEGHGARMEPDAKSACEDGLPRRVPLFASRTTSQLGYAGLITTRGAAARLKYRMTASPVNVIRARWPNAKPQPATVSRPTRSSNRPASGGPTKPPA
jgi:hypothetical protein